MLRALLRTSLIATIIIMLFSCITTDYKKGINTIEFNNYIENKPYTILYIWTSWCGISREGLLNDYYKNYNTINNDTVQSLLIVASDTNSINDFLRENKISLPYKYLYPDKYSLLSRNFKDEKNKDQFIKEFFNYECEIPGFPSVLLINNKSEVLVEGTEIKYAISNYRYFERQ